MKRGRNEKVDAWECPASWAEAGGVLGIPQPNCGCIATSSSMHGLGRAELKENERILDLNVRPSREEHRRRRSWEYICRVDLIYLEALANQKRFRRTGVGLASGMLTKLGTHFKSIAALRTNENPIST